MKKLLHSVSLILGFVLLLSGLIAYALGKHGYIDFDIEKISMVASIFGIAFIVGGACDIFIKQSKEAQIEANDERNITIANTAKASAFDLNTAISSTAIVILILADLVSVTGFFILVGTYIVSQIAFVYKLWSLQKKM